MASTGQLVRRLGVVILVISLSVVSAFVMLQSRRPAMPTQWLALQSGMTQPQVRGLFGEDCQVFDLRDLKGFETYIPSETSTVSGRWEAVVHYDHAGYLTQVWARFVHPHWRALGSSSRLIGDSSGSTKAVEPTGSATIRR